MKKDKDRYTHLKVALFILATIILTLGASSRAVVQNREIRVVNTAVVADRQVDVPIEMTALGDENKVSFGLNFDPAILTSPVVTFGPGATGARLDLDLDQVGLGRLEITLTRPPGQTFTPGTHQLLSVNFTVTPNAPAGLTEITLAGEPDVFQVLDVKANQLSAAKTSGVIEIPQPNPKAILTGLSPSSLTAGGGAFTLWVRGANFVDGSVVLWKGRPRATTYISGSRLKALIPAGDISTPGTAAISIMNPGGGTSNVLNFTIAPVVAVPDPVSCVSAASFGGAEIASESIAAAFGPRLGRQTQQAASLPLPTDIIGTRVTVKDSQGVERQSQLFYVSPGQVNYLVPSDTARGPATVTVISGDNIISTGIAQIARVAPGIFTANASGQGVAAAVTLRIKPDGSQLFEPAARLDSTTGHYVPVPVDLGQETDQVYLILYGTGIRFRNSLSSVIARINGINAEVLYAGAAPGFIGLDQCNILLPRNLAGQGKVDVALTVDGKQANTVELNIK